MKKELNSLTAKSIWFTISILVITLLSCSNKYNFNEEYFDNGNIKAQYYKKNGALDSTYKEFSSSGEPYLFGKYKNGLRIGKWIEWDIQSTNKDSSILHYDSNGILQERHYYMEDLYHPGKLSIEIITTYGEDTTEVGITYFDNGRKASEKTTKRDQLNGVTRYYSEKTGYLYEETYYVDAFENGLCKTWSKDSGKFESEKMYDHGKLLWKKTYKDGKLMSEKKY